jgi:hypothetical protein
MPLGAFKPGGVVTAMDLDKATLTRPADRATLSVWRSRTAPASTASATKISNTSSAIPCKWSPAVVVLDDDPEEEPIVIHAMPLRPKFHRYLR